MRRKIVKQGTATLMVSLPLQWSKAHGIAKGVEIEVEEHKDRLVLLPITTGAPHRITIDVSPMGEQLLTVLRELTGNKAVRYEDPDTYALLVQAMRRLLISLYKSGYDEISIQFEDTRVVNLIQDCMGKELAEYEIVEQTATRCVLQDLAVISPGSFEPALRRTLYLLLQMADESAPLIKDQKTADLQRLRFLEETNNRLTALCRRLLSKSGAKEPNTTQHLYTILESLEHIADQYKYLFDYLIQNRPSLGKETLRLYSKTSALLRDYVEFFLGFEKTKIVRIGAQRKHLVAACTSEFMRAPKQDAMVLHYLLIIVQLTFELVEPTIAVAPWANS